ncbi:nicotinate-nicotinamide nucleotide adenylyltransferase [Reinekea marina]|uniref:Probable nicotinate-nucleotide adenylyltransferase n=1 Tax=Reinekea marina TaxID=1310421 RepID=A0ABV7WMC6_9GAMM|nr:nicotinate-nicotinamide nucleotide adenylyltransferase [Reinekea forsetii]
MNRECVYGGTFDPFHNGHEAVCLHVLKHTALQEIPLRVIPCATPALKRPAQASDDERLAMLKLWRKSQENASRIVIDAIELEMGQVSYTADTLSKLAQRDASLTTRVWVLGVDAFNSIAQWHKSDELIRCLNFWVISRLGEESISNSLNLKEATDLDALWQKGPGYFWYDDRLAYREASSEIRKSINQKPWPVPQPIADYIERHELYQASA